MVNLRRNVSKKILWDFLARIKATMINESDMYETSLRENSDLAGWEGDLAPLGILTNDAEGQIKTHQSIMLLYRS